MIVRYPPPLPPVAVAWFELVTEPPCEPASVELPYVDPPVPVPPPPLPPLPPWPAPPPPSLYPLDVADTEPPLPLPPELSAFAEIVVPAATIKVLTIIVKLPLAVIEPQAWIPQRISRVS